MFERFSDQARRVVVLSAEQARDLSHDYIGTEHMLLGLIDDKIWRVNLDSIVHIPFTPRAKKVLQLSFPEAMQLGQSQVGTGHILLAMLTEGSGLASEILAERSAPATTIRELINRDFADDPGITTTAVTEQAAAPRPLHVTWHEVLPLVTAIEQRLSAIEEHLGMRGD